MDGPAEQVPVDPPARDSYVAHNTAAHWLHEISLRTDPAAEPWLLDLVRSYSAWTASINGAGLGLHEEISDKPHEWNMIYFDLLARSLGGLSASEVEALALSPITSLPDESFYDVTTIFLKALDRYFFGEHRIEERTVIAVRTAFAERLQRSGGWRWLKRDATGSIEIHIGPCISAMLFHTQYPMQRITTCYLRESDIDAAARFFPVLQPLIDTAPSLSVAALTLNVLEVSPRAAHLSFFKKAAEGWLASFPDDKLFWLEHGIGARMAAWINAVARNEPAIIGQDVGALESLHALLSRLVALGVAEAGSAEELLARVVREQDPRATSPPTDARMH